MTETGQSKNNGRLIKKHFYYLFLKINIFFEMQLKSVLFSFISR